MATRPSITVNVRASDAVYTTGVAALVGKATKISRSGADIAEGYKVDSPLGSQPVTAQEVNFEHNRNDLWVEWVSFGSSQADFDTHIVETDSSGDINVVGVNCFNAQVVTNGTENGITITANTGSKGINLVRDASNNDTGLLVTSNDGATGSAVRIDVSGDSTALLINAQSSPGLSILMTPDGGVLAPHITMATSSQLPSGTLSAGDIWLQQQTGKNDLRCGIGTSIAGYIRVAQQAPCYARSTDQVGFVISGSGTDQPITSFSFDTQLQPAAGNRVKVTLWGQVRLASNQVNNFSLIVRDTTAAGNPTICDIEIANPDTGVAGTFDVSATYAQTYSIPAGGARNFDLVWTGTNGAASSVFKGWVEIEEIPGA